MEDYEIKQTMNRGREPILQLVIKNDPVSLPIRRHHKYVGLNLFVKNVGRISAKSLSISLYIPKTINYAIQGNWSDIVDTMTGIRNTVKIILAEDQSVQIHPDQYMEISHGARSNRVVLVIPDNLASVDQICIGYYELIAENTMPKVGEILFIFNNSILTIKKKDRESLPFEIW